MKPGQAACVDYEYERNDTANLFMLFAPLEGWRHLKVTDRHTAIDYAHVLKDLADIHFPYAKRSPPAGRSDRSFRSLAAIDVQGLLAKGLDQHGCLDASACDRPSTQSTTKGRT
jgi:hypothetical protein